MTLINDYIAIICATKCITHVHLYISAVSPIQSIIDTNLELGICDNRMKIVMREIVSNIRICHDGRLHRGMILHSSESEMLVIIAFNAARLSMVKHVPIMPRGFMFGDRVYIKILARLGMYIGRAIEKNMMIDVKYSEKDEYVYDITRNVILIGGMNFIDFKNVMDDISQVSSGTPLHLFNTDCTLSIVPVMTDITKYRVTPMRHKLNDTSAPLIANDDATSDYESDVIDSPPEIKRKKCDSHSRQLKVMSYIKRDDDLTCTEVFLAPFKSR